jgi:Right handed beta helix region
MPLLLVLLLCLLPTPALASSQADEVFRLLQRLAHILMPQPRSTPVTYYVAPGGSNANSCETARTNAVSSAKATMNGSTGGISCLHSGETLVLKDGIYKEQLADSASGEHLGTTRPPSGTSWSAPTIITAEHVGKASLQLPTGGNHVVSFGLADTRYISVEGLVLDGTGHGACVWIGPASPIRMQQNLIKRCGGNGIYVDITTGVELIDNVIEDVGMEHSAPPGTHAIYFVGSSGLIRGNTIRGCPFFGIHLTSEHGGLYDNVIEQNRVTGCNQAGIVSQGGRTVIRNNLLHNNGIGLQCQGNTTQQWYGNTVIGYHLSDDNPDNYGILDLTNGCDFRNNLILGQRATSLKSYIYATHGNPTLQGNLCDNPGERCQILIPAGTVVVKNAAQGDFTLVTGSAAIDRGVALPDTLPTDYVGRAQGPTWDIGAYAYTTEGPPIPPDPVPPDPPTPGPRPLLVLQCEGSITAVPGVQQLRCVEQREGRR